MRALGYIKEALFISNQCSSNERLMLPYPTLDVAIAATALIKLMHRRPSASAAAPWYPGSSRSLSDVSLVPFLIGYVTAGPLIAGLTVSFSAPLHRRSETLLSN